MNDQEIRSSIELSKTAGDTKSLKFWRKELRKLRDWRKYEATYTANARKTRAGNFS